MLSFLIKRLQTLHSIAFVVNSATFCFWILSIIWKTKATREPVNIRKAMKAVSALGPLTIYRVKLVDEGRRYAAAGQVKRKYWNCDRQVKCDRCDPRLNELFQSNYILARNQLSVSMKFMTKLSACGAAFIHKSRTGGEAWKSALSGNVFA